MRTKISVAEMQAFKTKHKRHRRTKAEMIEFRKTQQETKPVVYIEEKEVQGKSVGKYKLTGHGVERA